ncbi:MAG: hypothetical protein EBU54_05605 [Mycobacteriaceae bacterium]|nr:hypothetical protein [Mycobacteriaceae bacterium]
MTSQNLNQNPETGKRRVVRIIAAALVALGVAGGGSLGLTAVAYADSGQSTIQDGRPSPVKPDRGAKAPAVSAPHLSDSAASKAKTLQNPAHPLAHLGMAVD